MNIFVGNLSFDATETDVKKLFEGFGNVASVVIVMRKEKKTPKSRGFGFVQMPDEQQALAAIAALNGKEFMGRVLDVNPARPKAEAQAVVELNKERQPKLNAAAEQYPGEEREQKKARFKPVLNKPGTYGSGRRTHSYMKRRGLAGMQEEAKPRRKNQENPMRWRKKREQSRPWQKSQGEPKPWRKAERESGPLHKSPRRRPRPGLKRHKNTGSYKRLSRDNKKNRKYIFYQYPYRSLETAQ